ncbi:hypothetical protein V8E53_001482, partial [Lactarius tabidus]
MPTRPNANFPRDKSNATDAMDHTTEENMIMNATPRPTRRSRKCLKRGDFQPPRLPELRTDSPFQEVGKKRSTKGKEHKGPYSPPLSAFIVPEVKTIPLPPCPTETGKNILLCMCCMLPSVAEYQKRFVSPRPVINDITAIPTARIVSSKGKSVMELYPELGRRKAYGTAILAGDESARKALNDMEKHDDEEILRMLEEAEEEVIAEIEIDEELLGQRDWATDYDSVPLPSPYPE